MQYLPTHGGAVVETGNFDGYPEAVRRSAIVDLPCARERIQLHRLYFRGDVVAADGCGQRLLYGEEDAQDDFTGARTFRVLLLSRLPL
jgi:hypothetical protein